MSPPSASFSHHHHRTNSSARYMLAAHPSMLATLPRPTPRYGTLCQACRAFRPAHSATRPRAAGSAAAHVSPPRLVPASAHAAVRSLHVSHSLTRPTAPPSHSAVSPPSPEPVVPGALAESGDKLDPARLVHSRLVRQPGPDGPESGAPTTSPNPSQSDTSQGQPEVNVTFRAAERLQTALRSNPSLGALRLAVEPGGCHGYQYNIALDAEDDADDL